MLKIGNPNYGKLKKEEEAKPLAQNNQPQKSTLVISAPKSLAEKPATVQSSVVKPSDFGLAANSGYNAERNRAQQQINRQTVSDFFKSEDPNLQGKYSLQKGLASAARKGLNAAAQAGGSTFALLEDIAMAPFELTSGLELGDLSDTAPLNTWAKKIREEGQAIEKEYEENVKAGGKAAKLFDQLGSATIAAAPQAAAAIATGGASAATTSANLIANATANLSPSIATTVSGVINKLASDPNYWVSFSQMVGTSYDNAISDMENKKAEMIASGITPGEKLDNNKIRTKAALQAIGSGLINAAIESGGGIQTLPKELQKGQGFWNTLVDSGVDEGKEEVYQGIIERATQNLFYNKGNKLASLKDENAVFSAPAAAKEFAGGFTVGTILSGSQIGAINLGQKVFGAKPQQSQITRALVDAGMSAEEAAKVAPIMESLLSGEEISGNQAASIATNDAAMSVLEETTGETIDRNVPLKEVKNAVRSIAETRKAETAGKVTTTAENGTEGITERNESPVASVASKMGKAGKAVITEMYDQSQNAAEYAEQMVKAYNAGLNGKSLAEAKLMRGEDGAVIGATGIQVSEAYKAGITDAQTALAKEKAAAQYASVAGTDSGLVHDEYVSSTLSKTTADRVNAAAKALGVRVRFVDSVAGGEANAQYSGNEILIEKDNPYPTAFLLGHELTHRMQELSPEAYRDFRKAVASDERFQSAVEDRIAMYEKQGKAISFDEAADEVVADQAGEMIKDGKLLDEFIAKHKENRTMLEKLLDVIRDFVKKLTGAEKKMAQTAEGKLMAALDAATEQASALTKNLESVDVGYDANTGSVHPQFSLKTWEESEYVTMRNAAAKDIAEALGISERKAKAYIDSVNSVAKMIAEDQSRLDYESIPGKSSFVGNVEYGGSFDFSTLCKKRRLLTGTFTAIQKALPNTALTANEILEIRNMMAEKGLEVSCGLCYVEGSRANMGGFTQEFINLYKKYNPGKWTPNMAEMNTPDGIEWVRINHPEVYEQYEYFWNHYGTLKDGDPKLFASQQKPKLYQLHTEYKGEVLDNFSKEDKDAVRKKNDNGGIRMQSFSDFEIVHLIDTMQVIMDMARVGLAGQAYTKVPDFAWALGNTGMKINLSLIAKDVDENGNLVFDNREGMNIDDAMALRDNYSENVGTILVAFTDEQIKAAMADDRIDFIIPFHRSQWKKSQYAAMGLPAKTKDYTYQQNEKLIQKTYHEYRGRMVPDKASNYMPNTYWDFSKSGKENAEAYLEMCARDNKRPKFYKFLVNNGDGSYSLQPDGSTDGYWKMLIDFKMYDNDGNGVPQRPVRPDFNMEEVTRMLNDYQGGHANFPIAHGVVDEFVDKYKGSRKGTKFSLKGNENPFTYKNLTAKPNVPLTEIDDTVQYSVNTQTRTSVVKEAQKNAALVGRTDKNGGVSVYVDDLGADVLLSGRGLKHGLDRRLQENAAVTIRSGEILKNAVCVNKLTPKLEMASSGSVLLGAAKGKNGTMYVVEFVVNEFDNEVDSINVLYSVNTKKEPAVLNAPKSTENPLLVTDSTISVAQLLDIARDNFPDVLSESVLRHYGYTERPDGVLGESALYSLKGTTALLEEYGAIEPGENPVRDVQVPKRTAKNQNVSKTVRTIMEAGATPDEALPNIEQMVLDGDFSYEVYGDKEAISGAESKIKHVGWASALTDWTKSVESGEVSKANTAMGWTLYNNAVNSGDTATALDILDNMVRHQRSAAQALQATRILKKLSPETQLYQAQKSVNKLQEDLNKKYGKDGAPKLKVDEEMAKRFMTATTQEARDEVLRDIYRDIGKQMPSTFIDKWNAWRYLAMLGNARTHVRNIVGNAGFAPVVATKNLTATAIESMVHRLSGGKLERSKSVLTAKDKDLLKAAWNDYAKVSDSSMDGKYSDLANANKYIEEGRQIFKFKPLEAARRGNSAALAAEDAWFSQPYYATAMASYCKAHGITADQIAKGAKIVDVARSYAKKEAQKATYQDTNAFSQAVSSWGRGKQDTAVQKGVGLVMEGILPFRKTPANILVRGIEYSPIGLMNGIKQAVFDVKKGKKTGAEAIDTLSAGLTGTGLLALGAYLAAEGLIRGHGDDEDEKNKFMELMGHQAYSLELPGGKSITLDWLAPECLPFFVGANLWEQTGKQNENVTLSSILNSVSTVSEPLLEMSCLQSLNDVFDSVGYAASEGLEGLPAALASAATSYLTSALPTLLGQAERSGEEQRMTTYTEKNAFLTNDMQYTLGKASARIPGWDYQQIPYIDAWGRKESSGALGERGFNNFLNPAYTSDVNESAMEKELLRLHDVTGETKVFPTRAAKYFNVDGKRVDLTADQYVKYATAKGQTAQKTVEKLTKSSGYKTLSNEEKVKAVSLCYEYANAVAKTKVSNYKPDGWVAKAINANKKSGISPDQYALAYMAQGGVESLKDKNGNTITNSKSLLVMQAVYNVKGLTDDQRQALFEDFNVGKTVRHYNKALVEETLAKMRKQ